MSEKNIFKKETKKVSLQWFYFKSVLPFIQYNEHRASVTYLVRVKTREVKPPSSPRIPHKVVEIIHRKRQKKISNRKNAAGILLKRTGWNRKASPGGQGIKKVV